jgi:hypothetical protein
MRAMPRRPWGETASAEARRPGRLSLEAGRVGEEGSEMKQGTASVLFGCHSPIHSFFVWLAWVKLYRRLPWPKEAFCILIHDVGHWGKQYLDDPKLKEEHSILGAKIAGFLFGPKWYDFVLGHNSYKSETRSALFDPDKYSWVIAPAIWQVTNGWFEPKLRRPGQSAWKSVKEFKKAMTENWKAGNPKRGHDIYLEQVKGFKFVGRSAEPPREPVDGGPTS